jgi:hypothetical protein
MSRIARFAVLTAALVSLLGVVSSAGAVTWHNTGGTVFAATGGASTLTVTNVQLRCTGLDLSGDAPTLSSAATYSMSGTWTSTGCSIFGLPYTVGCGYSLTLDSVAANHVFSGPVDVTCEVRDSSGTKVCHIEGQTPGAYRNNETGLGAQVTLFTSTTLRTTNGGAGVNCPLQAGHPAHLSAQVLNVTSSPAPTIVRT